MSIKRRFARNVTCGLAAILMMSISVYSYSNEDSIDVILENIESNSFTAVTEDSQVYNFTLNSSSYSVARVKRPIGEEISLFVCSFSSSSTNDGEKEVYFIDVNCDGALDSVYPDFQNDRQSVSPTQAHIALFDGLIDELAIITPISRRYEPNKRYQEPGHVGRLGVFIQNGRLLEQIGDLIESTDLVTITDEYVNFTFGNHDQQATFIILIENGYYSDCLTIIRYSNVKTTYVDYDCNGSIDTYQNNESSFTRVQDINYVQLYQAMIQDFILFFQLAERIAPR
ncbi:hypothetical protein [Halomonas sp. QHL1]|uniref:hypothetical protein n=1 Tax=Halomonas sp. QHL1 TaxID=1123773 RepID=UPI0008FD03BB|nr:hypothetical protein [Halomonas sp. QHL1]OJA04998.1 hypothetical protein QHL1GM_06120 [Halomonas sp. QHL1]